MVTQLSAISLVHRLPSMEPVKQAVMDAITTRFLDAAQRVTELAPEAEAPIAPPAILKPIPAAYDLPEQFPAVFIGGSNLRRIAGRMAPVAGVWQGTIEIHCWLADDEDTFDIERLARSLDRYAAAIWLCLVSADAERHLAGGELQPDLWAIAPYPEPGQTVAQQAIVLTAVVNLVA